MCNFTVVSRIVYNFYWFLYMLFVFLSFQNVQFFMKFCRKKEKHWRGIPFTWYQTTRGKLGKLPSSPADCSRGSLLHTKSSLGILYLKSGLTISSETEILPFDLEYLIRSSSRRKRAHKLVSVNITKNRSKTTVCDRFYESVCKRLHWFLGTGS